MMGAEGVEGQHPMVGMLGDRPQAERRPGAGEDRGERARRKAGALQQDEIHAFPLEGLHGGVAVVRRDDGAGMDIELEAQLPGQRPQLLGARLIDAFFVAREAELGRTDQADLQRLHTDHSPFHGLRGRQTSDITS